MQRHEVSAIVTSRPGNPKTTGRASVYALPAAIVFAFAFALSFAENLPALGIVFAVLFALSIIAAIVLFALTVKRINAVAQQAMREDPSVKDRHANG